MTDTCSECGVRLPCHLASCSVLATAQYIPVTVPETIGTHLAALNLFREADGQLYITVASAKGAMAERDAIEPDTLGIDYVNRLIWDAAQRFAPCQSVEGGQHNYVIITRSTEDIPTPYGKCTKCGDIRHD